MPFIPYNPEEVKEVKPTAGFVSYLDEEQVPEPAPEMSKGQQFSVGFVKGGLKTGKTLGSIGQWILDNTAGRVVNAATGKGFTNAPINDAGNVYRKGTMESDRVDALLTPQGGYENAGFMVERVAEFLAPTGLGTAGAKFGAKGATMLAERGAPAFVQGAADLAIKGGASAIDSGVKTYLQRGELDNEVKINALIGAVSPALAAGVQKIGSGILNMVIKPTIQDVKNGFKIENVRKYDVGGSLSTSLEKTSAKLSDNAAQLDDILSKSDATINVEDAFNKTVAKLRDKKTLKFGQIRDLNGGIDELAQDLADMHKEMPDVLGNYSQVPIQVANNQIKRGAGTKGAWVYGRIDKNAEAIDQVYSVFYNELKTQIEKKGGPAIRKLNSEMHDLIPIQSALIRRIPVADRGNVVGLGETMALVGAAFDPRALAVLLPTIAQKSGTFGNFLMKASENWVGKGAKAGLESAVSTVPN